MPELLQRATGMKVVQVKDRHQGRAGLRLCDPAEQGHVHPARRAAPARSRRRRAGCACRSISSSAPWRRTGRSTASASSSPAWAPTARWACGPSRRRRAWCWCRSRRRPNSTACRAARSTPGWPTSWRRWRSCRGRSSPICSAPRSSPAPEVALEDKTQSALEKVVILLRAHTGHDFSLYKRNTIYRRIERRMGIHQIDKMARLRPLPAGEPAGAGSALQGAADRRDELLPRSGGLGAVAQAGHPGAAREPAARPARCGRGCPAAPPARRPIPWPSCSRRRWRGSSPRGTSRCRSSPPTWTGTRSTRPARASIPANIAADVSPERLSRFFAKEERGYRVRKEIREMVIFAPQNLIMDPPFTKLDILSCRNLLIYLAPELQKKLIPLFHYSLSPGGVLFLGSAETVGDVHRPLRPARRQIAALSGGRSPSCDRSRSSFPRPSAPRPPRGARRPGRRQTAGQPPVAGGSAGPAALRPAGRARQRQGRHPLRQRADRQVPGTGGRQGQLEHLRHGPRRAALRAGRRLPEGAPAERTA